MARIYHADLWGVRGDWPNPQQGTKYYALAETNIAETDWEELHPTSPFYFFVPREETLRAEYEQGWKITDMVPVNSTGIVTARDSIVIDFDRDALEKRMAEFADTAVSNEAIRSKYFGHKRGDKYLPGDTRGWSLPEARAKLAKEQDRSKHVACCLYRPFDIRPIYYTPYMVDWTRPQVMHHMLAGENVALVCCRQQSQFGEWALVGVANCIMESCYISSNTREINYLFPLYLYPAEGEMEIQKGRRPNLNPEFIKAVSEKLGLRFVEGGKGDLEETFGPEDIFNYAYAVFHAPTYRRRYAEFLKIDFPRLPLTSDHQLFAALAAKGADLVALHLMESPVLSKLITKYDVAGSNVVEKVDYNEGAQRVCINKAQFFEGVPPEVWSFHIGGYQVCQKWLKDRKGRKLTYEDLKHYQKVVVALKETIRLMGEIDALIPSWPLE